MMTEKDYIFTLLKAALTGRPVDASTFAQVGASEWWGMFRLLQHNHVAALVSDVFNDDFMPPRDVYIPWLAEREKAVAWHRHQKAVEHELRELFQKENIDCLTLKGTRTARHYRNPELREFGDIDLYFHDLHDKADHLVHKALKLTITNDAPSHSRYDHRGVTIESHYDLLNRRYPRSNRRYQKLLKTLIPSPTFEVLYFLRHTAGHFATARITLREICDWYCMCNALKDHVDWGMVAEVAKSYGMEPFVASLDAIVERYFGHAIPLPLSEDREITRLIERDIVYGNRGKDTFAADGMERLMWKVSRRKTNQWKRKLVYSDSPFSLFSANIAYHLAKPKTFLNRM